MLVQFLAVKAEIDACLTVQCFKIFYIFLTPKSIEKSQYFSGKLKTKTFLIMLVLTLSTLMLPEQFWLFS